MGQVHRFLGLSVGVIVHDLSDAQRQAAYAADITYGTNNEFGFDYLRDNMKRSLAHCVQRELHYAIVDEVDSILIDEARTPLIISGPSEENTAALRASPNRVIPSLDGRHQGRRQQGHRGDRRLLGRREGTTRRRSPRRACTRSRSCSASRTSTTRRCCPCCTRSTRR